MKLKTIQQLYDEYRGNFLLPIDSISSNEEILCLWLEKVLQPNLTITLEALQFYADKNNYSGICYKNKHNQVVQVHDKIMLDQGEKAQQALKYFEAE